MLQVTQLVRERARTRTQPARLQPPHRSCKASLPAQSQRGFLRWAPGLLCACDYPPFCSPSAHWGSLSTQSPSRCTTWQLGGSVPAKCQTQVKQFPFYSIQERVAAEQSRGWFCFFFFFAVIVGIVLIQLAKAIPLLNKKYFKNKNKIKAQLPELMRMLLGPERWDPGHQGKNRTQPVS